MFLFYLSGHVWLKMFHIDCQHFFFFFLSFFLYFFITSLYLIILLYSRRISVSLLISENLFNLSLGQNDLVLSDLLKELLSLLNNRPVSRV